MPEIRIYETGKGPMCGSCVVATGRVEEAVPFPFPEWTGGYCAECWLTMPADFSPEGRWTPTRAVKELS